MHGLLTQLILEDVSPLTTDRHPPLFFHSGVATGKFRAPPGIDVEKSKGVFRGITGGMVQR